VRFDEKRNWAFVRAVLEDPSHEVRQIFIYAPLRARLLAYASKVGAPRDIRLKAAQAMMQPANALPHDDHFHIRISCPADQVDLGCTDLPLWHAPGSPDEFAPDLLAEAPRPRESEPPMVFSPYAWGRLSRLWSIEQGLCQKVDLACSDLDKSPACENFGDFDLPISPFVPIEMPETPAVPGLNTAPPPVNAAPPGANTAAPLAVPSSADDLESSNAMPSVDPVALLGATTESALVCAIADEPNVCERPMTAMVSPRKPTPNMDPSLLE
jgi:hypothetical protein